MFCVVLGILPLTVLILTCGHTARVGLRFGLVTLLLAGLSLASAYFGIFTALAWAVVMLAAAYVSFKGNLAAFSWVHWPVWLRFSTERCGTGGINPCRR